MVYLIMICHAIIPLFEKITFYLNVISTTLILYEIPADCYTGIISSLIVSVPLGWKSEISSNLFLGHEFKNCDLLL